VSDVLRLPDLPISDRVSTHRERALHDACIQFMREIERDRFRLLTVVIGGLEQWRRAAQSIWRGLRIGEDSQLLDNLFRYLQLLACAPRYQRRLLDAANNPAVWNDIMREAMPDIEAQREQVRRLENGWRG
jgi:hypothetical protein